MDERFRGKGLWIGLGVLAIIMLCVMMCGAGSMAMMYMSRGGEYVVPPAVEEGAPPPVAHGYGPLARGGAIAHGPFGFLGSVLGGLFKLAVVGLLLLVFFRLAMRLFWGPRFCGPRFSGAGYRGKPPKGDGDDWGPPWHAWHRHRRHWGPCWGPLDADEEPPENAEPDQDDTAAE